LQAHRGGEGGQRLGRAAPPRAGDAEIILRLRRVRGLAGGGAKAGQRLGQAAGLLVPQAARIERVQPGGGVRGAALLAVHAAWLPLRSIAGSSAHRNIPRTVPIGQTNQTVIWRIFIDNRRVGWSIAVTKRP